MTFIKKLIVILLIILTCLCALASIGTRAETIKFGNYWQTYEVDGVKTPLEWFILDKTDDAYLLITKYSVDANIYNHNRIYTTWKNSAVRQFLNSYFYNEAFSDKEKALILSTTIMPDTNPVYKKINQGQITTDNVFILSVTEAEYYFSNNNKRIATATPFAKLGHARMFGDKWAGAYISPSTGATCWRLRTMGIDNYHVCNVRANGTISYDGDILYSPHYALRPCIWIKK